MLPKSTKVVILLTDAGVAVLFRRARSNTIRAKMVINWLASRRGCRNWKSKRSRTEGMHYGKVQAQHHLQSRNFRSASSLSRCQSHPFCFFISAVYICMSPFIDASPSPALADIKHPTARRQSLLQHAHLLPWYSCGDTLHDLRLSTSHYETSYDRRSGPEETPAKPQPLRQVSEALQDLRSKHTFNKHARCQVSTSGFACYLPGYQPREPQDLPTQTQHYPQRITSTRHRYAQSDHRLLQAS